MSLDRLEEFASEGPQEGGDASISVHDLIARGTPVSWDEAVAIVEEMCEVAIARSGDEAPVPALADVLLDVTGRVALSRVDGEKSPAAAGRALHAVLANADVPVPLRLFVTQSAAPGTHRSLREFAAGLAYFGRAQSDGADPGRLQARRRAGASGRRADPVAAASCRSRRKNRRRNLQNRRDSIRRRALLWTGAVVFIAAAATAAWAWRSAGSRGTATEGTGVLSQASAALTDLANQVRERLTPAVSKDAQVPAAPASTDPRPRPTRRATPTIVAEETPLASRQLSIAQPSAWQPPVAVPTVEPPGARCTARRTRVA